MVFTFLGIRRWDSGIMPFGFCNRRAYCRGLFRVQCAVMLFSVTTFPLFAQSPPSSGADELLKQLNDRSTNEVDRELFGEKKKTATAEDGAGQGGAELEEQWKRELGAAAEKEPDNPVLDIARKMLDVQSRIAETDVGEKVQDQQRNIIADLDKLIEQAKKKCSGSSCCSKSGQCSSRTPGKSKGKTGSKTGTNPNKNPGKNSSPRPPEKKVVKPESGEIRDLVKELWGELPPNIREQMMQNPSEQFVPKYDSMIEEYYRRLSKEKR
jgi:hypothetical protein